MKDLVLCDWDGLDVILFRTCPVPEVSQISVRTTGVVLIHVLGLGFLTLPQHYLHILPEPHSHCCGTSFSEGWRKFCTPNRRVRAVGR